jgi:hypothetical protein
VRSDGERFPTGRRFPTHDGSVRMTAFVPNLPLRGSLGIAPSSLLNAYLHRHTDYQGHNSITSIKLSVGSGGYRL